MNVERSLGRQIDDGLGKDVSVGDHYRNVGLDHVEHLDQLGVARVLRLEKREILFHRDLLDGRGYDLARTALRLVRLSDDSYHFEPFTYQRAQRGRGEIGCAPEENAHYISSASSLLCAPGVSVRTFRM